MVSHGRWARDGAVRDGLPCAITVRLFLLTGRLVFCFCEGATDHIPLHQNLLLRLVGFRVGPRLQVVAVPAERAEGDALDALYALGVGAKAGCFGSCALRVAAARAVLGCAGAGGDEHLEGWEGPDQDG